MEIPLRSKDNECLRQDDTFTEVLTITNPQTNREQTADWLLTRAQNTHDYTIVQLTLIHPSEAP